MPPLIEPSEAPPRGKALLDELTHSAFQQQRGSASYAIYRPWFTRHDRGLLRLRRTAVDLAGRVAASRTEDPAEIAAEKALFKFSLLYLAGIFASLVVDRSLA